MTRLTVNGKAVDVDADPATPLLWALRDNLGMTGTKFGCGIALCGACTVHVGGQPVRSCVTPISSISRSGPMGIPNRSSARSIAFDASTCWRAGSACR